MIVPVTRSGSEGLEPSEGSEGSDAFAWFAMKTSICSVGDVLIVSDFLSVTREGTETRDFSQ